MAQKAPPKTSHKPPAKPSHSGLQLANSVTTSHDKFTEAFLKNKAQLIHDSGIIFHDAVWINFEERYFQDDVLYNHGHNNKSPWDVFLHKYLEVYAAYCLSREKPQRRNTSKLSAMMGADASHMKREMKSSRAHKAQSHDAKHGKPPKDSKGKPPL